MLLKKLLKESKSFEIMKKRAILRGKIKGENINSIKGEGIRKIIENIKFFKK